MIFLQEIVKLGFELVKVSRSARRRLSDSRPWDETLILLELAARNMTQATLCQVLSMDRGQMSKAVRRMTNQALLTRVDGSTRGAPLSLTDRGRRIASEEVSEFQSALEDELTKYGEQAPERIFAACEAVVQQRGMPVAPPSARRGEIHELGQFAELAISTSQKKFFGGFGEGVPNYVFELCAAVTAQPNEHLFIVADWWGTLRGGTIIRLDRERRTAHVLCIAVEYGVAYKGLGTTLITEALRELARLHFATINAFEPPYSEGGLFSRLGWKTTGRCEEASQRFQKEYEGYTRQLSR